MTEFQILQEMARLEEENAFHYQKILDNEERIEMLEFELDDLEGNEDD